MQEKKKVTVYFKTEFMGNIAKKEIYLVENGTMVYAQYKSAPFVVFKEPKGRLECKIVQSYQPCLIVLDGWGHPNPDSLLSIVKEGNGVIVKTAKYLSFDKRYEEDFDKLIDDYLTTTKDIKVIMDCRFTKGFDSLNEPKGV